MTPVDLLTIYREMSRQQIMMAYHGVFTRAVVDMLHKYVEHEMKNREVNTRLREETFGVLTACLENILDPDARSASSEDEEQGEHGIIILGDRGSGGHFITLGNLVANTELEPLKDWLKRVESGDKEELKREREAILQQEASSHMSGAGVGLLEVAIGSGNQLTHAFYEHDETRTLFTLEVTITGST